MHTLTKRNDINVYTIESKRKSIKNYAILRMCLSVYVCVSDTCVHVRGCNR